MPEAEGDNIVLAGDEDGLVTHAFYPATGDDADAAPLLPASPASRLTGGWDICQPLAHGSSNDDILDVLASGATALSLADTDPQTISARLQSVVLSAITIGFEGGFGAADDHANRYSDLYVALLRCGESGQDAPEDMRPEDVQIDLGIDPFAGSGHRERITTGLGLVHQAAPTHKAFAKVKLDKPAPRIQTLILFLILTTKIR